MGAQTIIVCGLPGAGKTTYLAALWEVLQNGGPETLLCLASRQYDDYKHVRSIHAKWIKGVQPERTKVDDREAVGLDLLGASGEAATLVFPDLGGEVYSKELWEHRACKEELAQLLSNRSGVVLFIHADKYIKPRHLVDELVDNDAMGESGAHGNALPFEPSKAPCQVKLVDLLQSLERGPLLGLVGRLSIVVSAWDRVESPGLTPEKHLADHFPLLDQYLAYGRHEWRPAVFGVSAQGANYVKANHDGALPPELNRVVRLNKPYERIQVVGQGKRDHDLTRPIDWVLS